MFFKLFWNCTLGNIMSDIQTSFVHQFIPFMVFIIIQLLKYSFNNNQLEPLSLLKFQTLHHTIEIFSHLI